MNPDVSATPSAAAGAPLRYDYAVIRVVPRVDRQEFINVGVVVSCAAQKTLLARVELDAARLAALWPGADVQTIEQALAAFVQVCEGGERAGPMGQLPPRERFHWLVATKSAVIQTSPVHCGFSSTIEAVPQSLFDRFVRLPAGG